MTKARILIFLLTIVVVASLGTIVSLYARGFRLDLKTFKFAQSGLLVVKSDPDGASVFINGDLSTATNATLSFPPGSYDITIRKEGYLSWSKRIIIEKEIVTEVNASLFRTVPSLSALTFSGGANPFPSFDFTKVAYLVPATKENLGEGKAGLWVIETINLPLGFAKEPKQVTEGDLTDASWVWSPDNREILLTTGAGVYLLDSSVFTPQNRRVNVATRKEEILDRWEEERKQKREAKIQNLPGELADVLTRKTSFISFSPDETKVLYIASGSATLPENLIKPLPGASTQRQERAIRSGRTYAYDIKEDRNFLIDEGERNLFWLPTSRHLVLAEDGKINVMDYDGTNRQVVYSGSYVSPHAYPFVDSGKLLILTNLGASLATPNLYTLNLK